ncbi:YheC/YheD family protein [Oceanobacillus halotolerans]|uniref:YheC/YheD family protein n=1 Tax=Oceanobacillus halotolerans TaxID=2663380 RepID=UPI0013D9EED8|nr:YheC/YheD family protein [Oceanobacillus halotolerans]
MLIGFMRNSRQPTKLAHFTAMLCMCHRIELIYIHPYDVDVNANMVEGKLFKHNTWVPVRTQLPPFIDIDPYCFHKKSKPIMNYLRVKTILSYDKKNSLNKSKLQKELKKDGQFSHLVLPTARIKSLADIETYLEKYSSIVIKPVYGEKGKGVYLLHSKENENTYILQYRKDEKTLTKEGLRRFFENKIQNKKYIVQKYVTSRTIQGDPFDCRIHVQKNGQGEWCIAKMLIRIGIGQKVISNVNQGGGISEVEPFLKANFGDNWDTIMDKLTELGKTLPYKIEAVKQTPIMTMGLDVGIDHDGQLYLFESNGSPTTDPLLAESAILRTEYYKYVIETKLKPARDFVQMAEFSSETGYLAKEINQLKENYNQLEKEKSYYEKKYLSIENSRSWRLTKPARRVGSVVKRIFRKVILENIIFFYS